MSKKSERLGDLSGWVINHVNRISKILMLIKKFKIQKYIVILIFNYINLK